MISTANLNQARKEILASKEKLIIVHSQTHEFNRAILEYGKFQILLSPELVAKHDRPKQLDSGLNHVLAKIATKNKIAIGIDLESLRDLKDKKQKARRLARIKENIKICKKAKCNLALINIKDKKDAQNFLLSLGAQTFQAKQSINKF